MTKKAEDGRLVVVVGLPVELSLGGLIEQTFGSFCDYFLHDFDFSFRVLGLEFDSFYVVEDASALIFWIEREIAFFRVSASSSVEVS